MYARIGKALIENAEYMKLESDTEADPEEVQSKAEELCYIQGYKDAFNLFI